MRTVILGFILVLVLKAFLDFSTQRIFEMQSVQSSIGTDEDPYARFNWEIMRTRDPRTGLVPKGIRRRELSFVKQQKLALRKVEYDASPQEWFQRGPHNIGGRTRALAVDITDENIIIAGGISGGMWRSIDRGISWTKTTTPDQLHSVSSIVQDKRPGKEHVWYYGTGEIRGNSPSASGAIFTGDGVFKSTNGGRSWTKMASTTANEPHVLDHEFNFVNNLIVDDTNLLQDEIYAATYRGIYKSVDGGTSWDFRLGGITREDSPRHTDLAITRDGVIYAALSEVNPTFRGIYRSVDGDEWVTITPPDWPERFRRTVIGLVPSNEKIVYFFVAKVPRTPSISFGKDGHGLWKYSYIGGDGTGSGGIWEDLSDNLPPEYHSQFGYTMQLSVKPDDENIVLLGGIELYRSTDGYSTPDNITLIGGYMRNHHVDQHKAVFLPSDPKKMINAHDGGLSITENIIADSVSWNSLNNGYITSQFYAVALDRETSGNVRIAGGMQDNGTFLATQSNVQSHWIELFGGDGGYTYLNPNGTTYYVSFQRGLVYRVVDNGIDMIRQGRLDPAGVDRRLFIHPFVVDPHDPEIMYYPGREYVWRNGNLGAISRFNIDPATEGWSRLDNSFISGSTITALEVSVESPQNRLYYGTGDSKIHVLPDANEGDPIKIDIGTGKGFPVNAYISSIAVNPENGMEVLLVFSNYEVPSIFHSANGGMHWTDVSGTLEEFPDGSGGGPSIRWGEILPVGGRTTYYVGTSTGLYSTQFLQGSSTIWIQEGENTIGNVVVEMIDSRPSDGQIAIATHGNGVYSNKVDGSNSGGGGNIPTTFRLDQNFPNPFNPSTNIRYHLLENATVSLKIYNTLGQLVKSFYQGEQEAGTYTFNWDSTNGSGVHVATGIYIARMTAITNGKKITLSRKMTLMK